MVAHESVPSPGGQEGARAEGTTTCRPRWFLERKLSRRTRTEFATVIFKIVATRLYAAEACFFAMLLAAWAGAFAHTASAHDWRVFRTLDGATLISVSVQATSHQIDLIPVLDTWTALLIFAPLGYTFAFRTAVAAAAALGYLGFSPPSSQLTERLAVVSDGIAKLEGHWRRDAIPFLIASIAFAYVLQACAAGGFERLVHLRKATPRSPSTRRRGPSAHLDLVRTLCAPLLILLTLLSATWAATVVQLSAEAPGQLYGFQGGLHQSRFLIVLAILAVCLSRTYDADRWLTAGLVLVVLFFLFPRLPTVPSFLEIPVGQGQLTRIGAAWGTHALWAAVLVFVPAIVLGHYLTGRLLLGGSRAG